MSERDRGVAVGLEKLDKLVVRNFVGLWEAVHAATDFGCDESVVDEVFEVVDFHDVVRNHVDGDLEVLVAFHGRAEVKIFEIASH